jgi:hypothetical protein
VTGHVDRMPLPGRAAGEQLGHLRLVLDDQQTHPAIVTRRDEPSMSARCGLQRLAARPRVV